MLFLWTFLVVVPVLALAAGLLLFPARTHAGLLRFFASRRAAIVLTILAWTATAYECATIGIDVFDAILFREPTNGVFVWVLASVLAFLTVVWMPKNLSCRALMGLFMLLPAWVLPVTRLYVPASGFAPVQLLVALVYLYALVGMYGMFHPERIEKALLWLSSRKS